MQAARIHNYGEPLVIEDIPRPRISHGNQVNLKVKACGLCHSDLHLMNGDWKNLFLLVSSCCNAYIFDKSSSTF